MRPAFQARARVVSIAATDPAAIAHRVVAVRVCLFGGITEKGVVDRFAGAVESAHRLTPIDFDEGVRSGRARLLAYRYPVVVTSSWAVTGRGPVAAATPQ
ncbi:hypothetical protein [Gordonia sp. WA4-43]|uniref:hypothetical protein n=1 Tax=Gordonia sp. WA4-43 TaxID=2878678 RepID=UPI001CFAFC63|nr:hypothetical protein [Gordonia sp. WA4-43]UCZ89859.1 hypothetical protein LEL84_23125 [Gordonia sp. WA4-43]